MTSAPYDRIAGVVGGADLVRAVLRQRARARHRAPGHELIAAALVRAPHRHLFERDGRATSASR